MEYASRSYFDISVVLVKSDELEGIRIGISLVIVLVKDLTLFNLICSLDCFSLQLLRRGPTCLLNFKIKC